MSTASVTSAQRFTRATPCPVCGGSANLPPGQGRRCYGFLSDDGEWAHCTREEFAGGLPQHPNSATYAHRVVGDCRCGGTHAPHPARGPIFTLPARNAPTGESVAEYDYRDEAGKLLYQVVRYEPKTFRQRRPAGNGSWDWSLAGVRRVLYRLPELLAADPADPVYIVEGEKDAEALAARGLSATCNVGGAMKWRDDYTETLQGRHVVIVPDNDEPGRRHAWQVARSLSGKAASVRVVSLPDVPEKGDVSDWLDAGNTVDQLAALAEQAPVWQEGEGDEDWAPPIPLDDPRLPAFPTSALPAWLRAFVEALATATQTPTDLAGLLALAACAVACAKKVSVSVTRGWVEPVNLYVVTVLPSGSRKSAVFRAITAPLYAWECRERDRLAPEIRAQETRQRIKEAALKRAEEAVAKEKTATKYNQAEHDQAVANAERLARELATTTILKRPRLITDDVTPETLKTLLAEQGAKLGLLSAEGGVFEIMAGRYTKGGGPNIEVYLHAHSGDELRSDRRDREELVSNPALTIGVTVQPDVIRALADKPAFRGRGLLARFLYAVPHSLVGRRDVDAPPVPDDVSQAYEEHLTKLLDLHPAEPMSLCFDGHASARFRDYQRQLEPELAEFGRLGEIADWGSKLAGAVARLAGLLHLAEHAGQCAPWDHPITASTVEAAIAIGTYLVPHAHAAFGLMGVENSTSDARYLVRWLRQHRTETLPQQVLWQATKRRFEKVERMQEALTLLVDHSYLRPIEGETGQPGRPRRPEYAVNPHLYKNTPNTPKTPTHAPQPAGFRGIRGKFIENENTDGFDDWGEL